MDCSLVVADGVHAGKVVPVKKFPFLIGRTPDCSLRPSSEMVSKQHCGIICKAGKVYIHDFKSRNGTFVNDVRITQPTQLHDGDALKVGPLGFTVRLSATVPVDQATPLPLNKEGSAPESDEDEIAALLMEMDEAEQENVEEEQSTTLVMEPKQTQAAVPTPAPAAPRSAPPTPAAKPPGNTADAALKILSKMSRRDRK